SDDDETNLTAVIEAARNRVAPELWGRIDERLVFEPLGRDQVREIAVLQLRESSQTLFAEREISLDWDDDVLDFLLNCGGFTPETGARGMRQTIQRHIEASVAEQILAGDFAAGDIIEIRTTDDKILFEKGLSAA
ncbi:ATP-dependent Clp protease ATP-binding subunit, partial [Myxococcota bacterium]|nr:ATP-dependent Clp protease ATP-binding subunit [Myxococcota bacterium]